MKIVRIMVLLILALSLSTPALAVRHPRHYQRQAEESKIKAIAIVERVKETQKGKRYSTQRVTFRLVQPFEEDIPQAFMGYCSAVLHKWQRPGVGGEIYFYPRKGDRVLVTVSRDGGFITSYTRVTPKLEKALNEDPESVVFGMGEASVFEGEREKKILLSR